MGEGVRQSQSQSSRHQRRSCDLRRLLVGGTEGQEPGDGLVLPGRAEGLRFRGCESRHREAGGEQAPGDAARKVSMRTQLVILSSLILSASGETLTGGG